MCTAISREECDRPLTFGPRVVDNSGDQSAVHSAPISNGTGTTNQLSVICMATNRLMRTFKLKFQYTHRQVKNGNRVGGGGGDGNAMSTDF
jgi:hypothetical protein